MSDSCDPKCYELAQYFLPDGKEASLMDLAGDIQRTVECWLNDGAYRFKLDDEDSVACSGCGSQQRHPGNGLLICECPDPGTLHARRISAQSPQPTEERKL